MSDYDEESVFVSAIIGVGIVAGIILIVIIDSWGMI